MPIPFPAGDRITPAAVLNAFVTQVQNGGGVTLTPVYYSGNVPRSPFAGIPQLGPASNPPLVWPAGMVGQPITTNMFYILHHLAIKLTRIRLGRFVFKHGEDDHGNGSPGSFSTYDQVSGWRMVGYHTGNVIGFDIPSVPAPTPAPAATPYPFNGQQMNNFLTALRNAVIAVQNDTRYASEFSACHTSCHNSCHGSRGRR